MIRIQCCLWPGGSSKAERTAGTTEFSGAHSSVGAAEESASGRASRALMG